MRRWGSCLQWLGEEANPRRQVAKSAARVHRTARASCTQIIGPGGFCFRPRGAVGSTYAPNRIGTTLHHAVSRIVPPTGNGPRTGWETITQRLGIQQAECVSLLNVMDEMVMIDECVRRGDLIIMFHITVQALEGGAGYQASTRSISPGDRYRRAYPNLGADASVDSVAAHRCSGVWVRGDHRQSGFRAVVETLRQLAMPTCPHCRRSLADAVALQGPGTVKCPSCGQRSNVAPEPPPFRGSIDIDLETEDAWSPPVYRPLGWYRLARAGDVFGTILWRLAIALWCLIGVLALMVFAPLAIPAVVLLWFGWRLSRTR